MTSRGTVVRRATGILGAAAGLAATGVAAGMAVRRYALGRPEERSGLDEVGGLGATVLTDDGLPLHVEIDGDEGGPGGDLTIVFCHGYSLHRASWRYQRGDLADLGRLVLYDHRSHGRSGHSDRKHATIDQLGDDLYAVLRMVAPEGPLVLVGHSMGGMTIMALAERHPELFGERVVGVGLIGTCAGPLGELTLGLPAASVSAFRAVVPRAITVLGAEQVERLRTVTNVAVGQVVRRYAFGSDGANRQAARLLGDMIASTPLDVVTDFYPAVTANDKLDALGVLDDVQTLVMVGEEDRLTPVSRSRAIAAALPHAELVVVPGAGHMVILERPELVNDALRRLVRRARSAAGHRPR
ncbi:MAG: alpha/beta fold hydrolase [Streptosporangiaceae bacterium]